MEAGFQKCRWRICERTEYDDWRRRHSTALRQHYLWHSTRWSNACLVTSTGRSDKIYRYYKSFSTVGISFEWIWEWKRSCQITNKWREKYCFKNWYLIIRKASQICPKTLRALWRLLYSPKSSEVSCYDMFCPNTGNANSLNRILIPWNIYLRLSLTKRNTILIIKL